MIVKRIVTNIAATDVSNPAISWARTLRSNTTGRGNKLIGCPLEIVMDLGWITTFASPDKAEPQLSVASEGGSGTAVPDISVEVDDLDEALRRVRAAGLAIEYGPTDEDWDVRRFYVRDPFGRLVNILAHM